MLVKPSNQTVTNSSTLTDDSALTFSVTAGDVWIVELYLGLDGNNSTGDGKVGLTASPATFVTAVSSWDGVYYTTVGTLTHTSATAFASTTEAVTSGTTVLN